MTVLLPGVGECGDFFSDPRALLEMYWQAPDAVDVLLEDPRVVDALTPAALVIAGAGAVDRWTSPMRPDRQYFVAWLERRQSAASPRLEGARAARAAVTPAVTDRSARPRSDERDADQEQRNGVQDRVVEVAGRDDRKDCRPGDVPDYCRPPDSGRHQSTRQRCRTKELPLPRTAAAPKRRPGRVASG